MVPQKKKWALGGLVMLTLSRMITKENITGLPLFEHFKTLAERRSGGASQRAGFGDKFIQMFQAET